MKNTAKYIHLRIFKSFKGLNEVLKDESGKVRNENQVVKLQHGSIEYKNYLKHLRANGVIKVDIEAYGEVKDGKIDSVKEPKEVIDEISKALGKSVTASKPTPKKEETEATPDTADSANEETEDSSGDDELEAIRKEYEEVMGKKPHTNKKLSTLQKEIKEAKK